MARRERYRNYKKDIQKAIPWLIAAAVAFFVMVHNVFEYGKQDFEILEQTQTATAGAGKESALPSAGSGDNGDNEKDAEETAAAEIFVDVAGAVALPGVVRLEKGSRVYQAVEAAGGWAADCDTREVNLAAVVEDGQKIYIPTKQEMSDAEKNGLSAGGAYIPKPDSPASQASADKNKGKVNINTEDSSELQLLSGVGPATAERILTYRKEHGNFINIEELKQVKGIGDKTFEKLKDSIYVP